MFILRLLLQAGATGKQQLPEKFRVTQTDSADSPQDIYINREIQSGVLGLESQVILPPPSKADWPLQISLPLSREGPPQSLGRLPTISPQKAACMQCLSQHTHASFLKRPTKLHRHATFFCLKAGEMQSLLPVVPFHPCTFQTPLQDENLDPGVVVARGTPIQVRIYVPLWLVNATTLPLAALVVEVPPPPKAAKDADAAQGSLLNAAESIKLRVMQTGSPGPSGRSVPTH